MLNMETSPSIEDLEKICSTSGFDLLLRRNVQHIWEKIFLSLDYDSFKNCLAVCRAWSNIFNEESFLSKANSTFPAQTWLDTEHLERQVWKSSKIILAWTTHGEEVAYIEGNKDFHMVYFINREGRLTSGQASGLNKVNKMWILRHIILIETADNVYSVDKLKMKQTKLFSWSYDSKDVECTKFIPNVGVCFLSVKWRDLDVHGGDDIFSLREVSYDHIRVDEWEKGEADKTGCCSSVNNVAPQLALRDYDSDDDDDDYYGEEKLGFSEDGSHFIHNSDYEIQVFSVDKREAGLTINHLWDDKDDLECQAKANSQYVVYVVTDANSKYLLKLRDIRDGSVMKSYDISSNGKRVAEVHSLIITEIRVSLFISNSNSVLIPSLIIVDLETNDIGYSNRHDAELKELRSNRYHVLTDTEIISNGNVVIYPTADEKKFFLLDLTSADPNEVLDGRRLIAPSRGIQVRHSAKAGKTKQFTEVKPGLCIFEVQSKSSRYSNLLLDANKKKVNFILEKIAWKGELMPKAMDTWVKWLEKAY